MNNMNGEQQFVVDQISEQLTERYGDVTFTPQGDNGIIAEFEIAPNENVSLYIDATAYNSNEPLTAVVNRGGGGGLGDVISPIISNAEIDNLGNKIVLSGSASEKFDAHEELYEITKILKTDVKNWESYCFSESGDSSPAEASNFIGNHPELAQEFKIYIADADWKNFDPFSKLGNLKDSEIYVVVPNGLDAQYFQNRNKSTGQMGDANKNGANAALMIYKNGNKNVEVVVPYENLGKESHSKIALFTLNNGLDNKLEKVSVTINIEEFVNKYCMEKGISVEEAFSYGNANDNIYSALFEELKNIDYSGVVGIGNGSNKDLKTIAIGNQFLIKLKDSDVEKLIGKSNEFSPVLANSITSLENIEAVAQALNGNSALFNPGKTNLTSTANLAGGILGAQNAFLSISNVLYNRSMVELGLITDITQRYYDMDGDLTSLAASLNDLELSALGDKKYIELAQYPNILGTNGVDFQKNFQIESFSNIISLGKISKSDFLELGSPNGVFMTNLQSNKDSAIATRDALNAFRGEIGVSLTGQAWEAVGVNLGFFAGMHDLNAQAADKLMSAVGKACKMVTDYMGDDETLDTAQIPALEAKIASLKADLAATKKVSLYDPATKSAYTIEVPVLTGAARAAAENALREAQAALTKLNGLGPVIEDATKLVNDTLQEIYNSYGTAVNDIRLGTVEPYSPSFSAESVNHSVMPTTTYGAAGQYVSNYEAGEPTAI